MQGEQALARLASAVQMYNLALSVSVLLFNLTKNALPSKSLLGSVTSIVSRTRAAFLQAGKENV